MDKVIRTLLNGYEQPACLSSAEDGNIVCINNAAQQKFNLTEDQLTQTKLHDLFSSRRIIRESVIWERSEKQFVIREEKLEIAGQTYIHSVIKPVEEPRQVLDLIEMQKEMAKLLVHLFHSPLNGVSGFTELLQSLDLTEKQRQYVDNIEGGLNEFKNILADIHSLAEDLEVQRTTVDVQKFGRMLIDQYSPEKKKRIDLTIDPNLIKLHTDYVLLKDIITELLDNALEFSINGTQNIKLEFAGAHTISVTSYGPKIPESYTEKIFYPFFTNKARGVGLGLSKCMYLAHEMGYQVILSENSSVNGIRFEVQLK